MDAELIVPVTMFASIVGIVWLVSHFNYKKRLTLHETMRHAVEKGQDMSGDLMEKLALITDPVRADLRKGVLFLAFGAAFGFLATMIGMENGEAIMPMIGIASFPVFLGLAYLGLWKFGHGGRNA